MFVSNGTKRAAFDFIFVNGKQEAAMKLFQEHDTRYNQIKRACRPLRERQILTKPCFHWSLKSILLLFSVMQSETNHRYSEQERKHDGLLRGAGLSENIP